MGGEKIRVPNVKEWVPVVANTYHSLLTSEPCEYCHAITHQVYTSIMSPCHDSFSKILVQVWWKDLKIFQFKYRNMLSKFDFISMHLNSNFQQHYFISNLIQSLDYWEHRYSEVLVKIQWSDPKLFQFKHRSMLHKLQDIFLRLNTYLVIFSRTTLLQLLVKAQKICGIS